MSDQLINENVDLSKRKEQALDLNIDNVENMNISSLEEEIVIKLERGMHDLKRIVNEINLLEVD